MGVAEDVEVFFPVGGAFAGVVGADSFAFEDVAGGLVEAGGEGVGESVAFGGVAGPAGGGVPTGAVAGGVDVEGDEEDVGGVFGCADGGGAADTFFEGGCLRFQGRGVGHCGLCPGGLRGFGWHSASFLIWNSVSIIYCSDPTMPT